MSLGWRQDGGNNNDQQDSQQKHASRNMPSKLCRKSLSPLSSPGIKFKNVHQVPKSPDPSLSLSMTRDSKSPSLSLRRSRSKSPNPSLSLNMTRDSKSPSFSLWRRSRSKSPNPSLSSLTLSIASTSRMSAYTEGKGRREVARRSSDRSPLHPARDRAR